MATLRYSAKSSNVGGEARPLPYGYIFRQRRNIIAPYGGLRKEVAYATIQSAAGANRCAKRRFANKVGDVT